MINFDALPNVVAILGSREFPKHKRHWVESAVARLKPQTIVVSGGAIGVDSWAEEAALKRQVAQRDMHFKPFYVEDFEWRLLGKSVGFTRNEAIAHYLKRYAGHMIIFALASDLGEKKGGSYNNIENCKKLSIPFSLITDDQ